MKSVVLFMGCYLLFPCVSYGEYMWCVQNVYAQAQQTRRDLLQHLNTHNKYEYTSAFDMNIRRLCAGAYYDYMMDCELYKCLVVNGEDFIKHLPLRINNSFNLANDCDTFLTIDSCADWDIPLLKEKLLYLETSVVRNELIYNMDNLISELDNGNYRALPGSIGQNDGSIHFSVPEVCYYASSKNETIWHAVARSKTHQCYDDNQICVGHTIAEKCFLDMTKDEDIEAEFYTSVFLMSNDEGKTPIALAVENGSLRQFKYFRKYFEQNNIEYKKLLKAAAEEASVPYSTLSKAWYDGAEIKAKKSIKVDKSDVRIKTKYKL